MVSRCISIFIVLRINPRTSRSRLSLLGLPYPLQFLKVNWQYGKHHPAPIETFPFDTGVDASRLSKYTVFEAPDPIVWCPRGYAIIVTDPRGTWNSEGDASFQTPVEGADEYDLIEWTAKQSWCNGKIGLGGVSYL